MLYLPAGWFHEVTSLGEKGHMAFNYWSHPPDNLDPSLAGFARPYTRGYWPAIWAEAAAARGEGGEVTECEAGGAERDEEGGTEGGYASKEEDDDRDMDNDDRDMDGDDRDMDNE